MLKKIKTALISFACFFDYHSYDPVHANHDCTIVKWECKHCHKTQLTMWGQKPE